MLDYESSKETFNEMVLIASKHSTLYDFFRYQQWNLHWMKVSSLTVEY